MPWTNIVGFAACFSIGHMRQGNVPILTFNIWQLSEGMKDIGRVMSLATVGSKQGGGTGAQNALKSDRPRVDPIQQPQQTGSRDGGQPIQGRIESASAQAARLRMGDMLFDIRTSAALQENTRVEIATSGSKGQQNWKIVSVDGKALSNPIDIAVSRTPVDDVRARSVQQVQATRTSAPSSLTVDLTLRFDNAISRPSPMPQTPDTDLSGSRSQAFDNLSPPSAIRGTPTSSLLSAIPDASLVTQKPSGAQGQSAVMINGLQSTQPVSNAPSGSVQNASAAASTENGGRVVQQTGNANTVLGPPPNTPTSTRTAGQPIQSSGNPTPQVTTDRLQGVINPAQGSPISMGVSESPASPAAQRSMPAIGGSPDEPASSVRGPTSGAGAISASGNTPALATAPSASASAQTVNSNAKGLSQHAQGEGARVSSAGVHAGLSSSSASVAGQGLAKTEGVPYARAAIADPSTIQKTTAYANTQQAVPAGGIDGVGAQASDERRAIVLGRDGSGHLLIDDGTSTFQLNDPSLELPAGLTLWVSGGTASSALDGPSNDIVQALVAGVFRRLDKTGTDTEGKKSISVSATDLASLVDHLQKQTSSQAEGTKGGWTSAFSLSLPGDQSSISDGNGTQLETLRFWDFAVPSDSELEPSRFALGAQERDANPSTENDRPERLVVEVELTALHRIQLDCVAKGNDYQMVVRSSEELPPELTKDMRDMFYSSCEISGSNGRMSISRKLIGG